MVSRISECVARGGANILNVDLHIDFEAEHPTFYARRYSTPPSPSLSFLPEWFTFCHVAKVGLSEFAFHPERWPRDAMDRDFAELGGQLAADRSLAYVSGTDKPPKMAVLASRQVGIKPNGLHT